jgi:serine/threonine-protein kinase
MGLEYDFAKVLDFGLVKLQDQSGELALTAEQRAIGTPAYMAPEVILGDHNTNCRADVYALGCVAYFLLTGERVFEGDTPMKVMMRHVDAEPVAPSLRTEQPISADIDALVLACLQKDPGRRPRDADAVYRMACACRTNDTWDQEAARQWWESHLPPLTRPDALSMPAPAAWALA